MQVTQPKYLQARVKVTEFALSCARDYLFGIRFTPAADRPDVVHLYARKLFSPVRNLKPELQRERGTGKEGGQCRPILPNWR